MYGPVVRTATDGFEPTAPESMTQTTNPRIERALAIVSREAKRTEEEVIAFDRFLRRLSDLRPPEPTSTDGTITREYVGTRPPQVGVKADRLGTAYRETVMSTAHYEEEYDDSFEASVTLEFGDDIAYLLTEADRLGPPHLRAVRCAVRHAKEERESFLSALDEERESVEHIDTRLSDIESRLFELRSGTKTPKTATHGCSDRSVSELAEACERLIDRRQETIHSRSVSSFAGIDAVSLVGYLYREFDETCPILADILEVYRSLRRSVPVDVPQRAD